MFGPLNLKDHKDNLTRSPTPEQSPCPLCDDIFNLKICLDVFLKHLLTVHNLVIEDVQNVPKLHCYLDYWHRRFDKIEMSRIVPFIKMGDSCDDKYYLISTLMKEDKDLRHRLHLENAMERQEWERIDETFERDCLFCRLHHKGPRRTYLEHLSTQHNLQLGNPQNLVFVDDLLHLIESKLNDLQCIYCEKTFPDRTVLKEHMRKKLHKRINPSNERYDKFYIVNYANEKTTTTDRDDVVVVSDRANDDANSDSEYGDWIDSESTFTCLFCGETDEDINRMCLHMHTVHRFNFPQLKAHLNFYQRVKLVNYLRKQMHLNRCPVCDSEDAFEGNEHLLVHMRNTGCFKLPETEKFDQPEYYFPTYENDTFLYYLEDIEDDDHRFT